MRRLCLALCVLLISVAARANPLLDIAIDTPLTFTFDTFAPGFATCGGTQLAGCLNFHVVSGSGTIRLDLFDDLDQAPLLVGAAQYLGDGLEGTGVSGSEPLTDQEGFIRVFITGNPVFDYFAVSMTKTVPSGYLVQTFSQGVPPIDVPEPASLLLACLGAGVWILRRSSFAMGAHQVP